MWRFDSSPTDAGLKRLRRRMILSSIVVLALMAGLIGRDMIAVWQTEVNEENRALLLVAEALRTQTDAAITVAAQAQAETAIALGGRGSGVDFEMRSARAPANRTYLIAFLKGVAAGGGALRHWSLYDAAGHLVADT